MKRTIASNRGEEFVKRVNSRTLNTSVVLPANKIGHFSTLKINDFRSRVFAYSKQLICAKELNLFYSAIKNQTNERIAINFYFFSISSLFLLRDVVYNNHLFEPAKSYLIDIIRRDYEVFSGLLY